MPSPAITINSAKVRIARAEKAMREALELARAATAAPDYCGPANLIEEIERVAAGLAALRPQLRAWAIEQNLRRLVPERLLRDAVRELIAQPGRLDQDASQA